MILKAALIGVVIAAMFGTGLFAMADIPDRINDISLDWGRGECMDEDYDERHEECEEHQEECEHLEGEDICEEHSEECEEFEEEEEEHCWENGDSRGCVF